jgi:hypothetical protein
MLRDDQLRWWIDTLRRHLDAGTLDSLPPVDLGDGTADLTGALTIRVMLADLAHLDALDTTPTASFIVSARYRRLLTQFARLSDLLVAHA